MADELAKSCRIFIRYGSASANCLPTENDVRQIFSVHGNIVGKFCVKACIIHKNIYHGYYYFLQSKPKVYTYTQSNLKLLIRDRTPTLFWILLLRLVSAIVFNLVYLVP